MNRSVSIFILCDAMGWEIIRDLDFLQDLLPYRYRARTVFGYSSAALPSIYTGLQPSEHGRWSMWCYSPAESYFRKTKYICQLPEAVVRQRNINRALISRFYKRFSAKITDYFCLYNIPLKHLHKFDLCGYRDIYKPGAFSAGESIFDCLVKREVAHLVLTWRTPLLDAFRILVEDIKKESREFYFLYTADFDTILHKSGNDDMETTTPFLKLLETKVREVYNAAREKYQNINLYLFSDHGMCNVEETFDLQAIIRELPVKEFKDYVPFYDSTMARFNTFSGRVRELLTQKLLSLPFGRVLSEDELKALGVYFPDNKYGNIIYLMDPGNMINPSFVGTVPPKGMHGYHPDHKDSYAAFLSNREQKGHIGSICDFYGIMKSAVMKIRSL